MKLGNYKFTLSFLFLLFYTPVSLTEDKVSTSPLINLNELKPSLEEVEDSTNDITSDEVIKDKKNILSERQVKKRKRLIKHIKSSKK